AKKVLSRQAWRARGSASATFREYARRREEDVTQSSFFPSPKGRWNHAGTSGTIRRRGALDDRGQERRQGQGGGDPRRATAPGPFDTGQRSASRPRRTRLADCLALYPTAGPVRGL